MEKVGGKSMLRLSHWQRHDSRQNGVIIMARDVGIFKRYKPILIGLFVGLLWMLFSSIVWAKEINLLNNLEVQAAGQNKIELTLEFAEPLEKSQDFSVEAPPTIVFDFPSVKNKLSKEQSMQTLTGSNLKKVKVIEAKNKTRLVIDLKRSTGYEAEVHENILKITLDEHGKLPKTQKHKAVASERGYQIKSFDFRRGERGEARIIFDLSTSKAAINFKDEGGKIITEFLGANIADNLAKNYDVVDFGTPVKDLNIVRVGNDVALQIEAKGNYDKIAYQMDKQFIIEIRSLTKEEKEEQKQQLGQFSGDKISLNFQDIEVRSVLQIIADFAGFNVITSDSVKGNITLRLQNVPWDQALDIILKTKGLDKRQIGNVMLIGPADDIAAREKADLQGQKALEDLGPLKSELVQINYADAGDMAALLKDKNNSLMTSRGNVTVDKRTNTLLVQDTVNKLEEIKSLLKKLDVAVRQVEIATQIVTADNTLETALGIRFGGAANAGIGQRRLGIGSNVSRARAIGEFRDATTGLPVPAPNHDYTQAPGVSTTTTTSAAGSTTTASTSITDNMNIKQAQLGTDSPTVNNTEGLFSDLGALTQGSIFGSAGLSPAKLGLALAKLPNGTLLDLELQALEYESRSHTIARPKIVTLDQNKATVEKGVDIPYLQAASSGATSVSYKTAALKLEVTPHITPDDKISMDLSISNDTQGTPVAAGPVVNTNRLQTKVLVDNGETVVLGGVMSIVDNKSWGKVPFFGDLPIIGALFRNKYVLYSPKELIIFLTPKILNPLITKDD